MRGGKIESGKQREKKMSRWVETQGRRMYVTSNGGGEKQ